MNSKYTIVKATAAEIAAFVAKNGRQPSVNRLKCNGCSKRIWGGGLAVGSHDRSKACRAEMDRQAMQAANAKQVDNDGESVRRSEIDIPGFGPVPVRTMTAEEVAKVNRDKQTRYAVKFLKAYAKWVEVGQQTGSRKAMVFGWGADFAQTIGMPMPLTNHDLLVLTGKAEDVVNPTVTADEDACPVHSGGFNIKGEAVCVGCEREAVELIESATGASITSYAADALFALMLGTGPSFMITDRKEVGRAFNIKRGWHVVISTLPVSVDPTVTADIVTPDVAADIDAASTEHDMLLDGYVAGGFCADGKCGRCADCVEVAAIPADNPFSPDCGREAMAEADRDDAAVLKPVTFADVAESCGWLSTDIDAVTAVADGPIGEGFWSCCMARPAVAVAFTSEDTGERVWYAGCRACASTVPAQRLAVLPDGFVADRMVNLRAELAAGQAAGECVCDVITDMGAASLPDGGVCCNGCGSVFTRSGEQESEEVAARSLRIVQVKAGRTLIDAVKVYMQAGQPMATSGANRKAMLDAYRAFYGVMGWGEVTPDVYGAMAYAQWAKDAFSELA